MPRPTKHGLPDATYNADAEYATSTSVLNSHLYTAAACMFASVLQLRQASRWLLSRLPPMAWLDSGSRSCSSWAPALLLATADKQIRTDKGKRKGSRNKKKALPQKVGRRQSPLLVRAG